MGGIMRAYRRGGSRSWAAGPRRTCRRPGGPFRINLQPQEGIRHAAEPIPNQSTRCE
jgi:hypothetical protein